MADPVLASRFELTALLGEGAMGRVWRARDRFLDREVAVKCLTAADPESRRLFQQEVRLLARLSHPNLVRIFDFFGGEGENPPGFSMECLSGEPLRPAGAAGSAELFPRVFAGLLSGLNYLHSHGVLHRDLKPGNVFWTEAGEVKILDFGLATADEGAETPRGTLAYLPPEAFWGEYQPASDLFSLGVLSYEVLTGRLPYPRPLSSGLDKLPRPESLRSLRPDLSPAIAEIVDRLLEPAPGRRPASAAALLRYWSRHDPKAPVAAPEDQAATETKKIPWIGDPGALDSACRWLAGSGPEPKPRLLELTGPTGVGRSRWVEELHWRSQLAGREFREWGLERGAATFGKNSPAASFRFAREWSAQGPCTLAFLDLHLWPEPALRRLRDALSLMHATASGLSFLCEYNSEQGSEALTELRKFWDEWPGLRRCSLRDLESGDAKEFLRGLSGAPLDPEREANLLAKAGGRPLLIAEALRRPESPAPLENFAAAARFRMEQLEAEARRLFSLCVVHPEPVALETAQELFGGETAGFDAARLALQGEGLLSGSAAGRGALSLAHPSLREAFAQALPDELRREAHRRWVQVLERSVRGAPQASPVALHLADHARAVDEAAVPWEWELAAAGYESAQHREAAAAARYRSLLPRAQSAAQRVLIHAHLAHLHYLLGRFDDSLADYDAWIRDREDDPSGLQRAKHHFYTGLVLRAAGRTAEARERLEACLQVADAEAFPAHRPYQARAHSLLASLDEARGDAAAAMAHLQVGVEMAGGDPALCGEMEKRRADFYAAQLNYPEALASYAAALERFGRAGDAQSEAIALQAMGLVLREQGRLGDAAARMEASLAAAERGGELLQWARYTLNLGLLAFDRGDYARAEELQERAASILQYSGTEGDRKILACHRAALRMHLGDFSGATRSLGETAHFSVPGGDPLPLALEAELAYLGSRYPEAEKIFLRAWSSEPATASFRLQAALGVARCRLRRGHFDPAAEPLPFLSQSLALLEGPVFELWRRALAFLGAAPRERDEARLMSCLEAMRACELPELRLDLYRLLHLELRRGGTPRLAARISQTIRHDWHRLRDALREDHRMDFEKNRGLGELEQRLDTLLPQAGKPEASEPGTSREPAISESRFRQFSAINRQIAQQNDLGEVLERVMDAAIELTAAERGFLLLKHEGAAAGPLRGFEVKTARGLNQRSLASEEFQLSMTAVRETVETGAALLTDNAQLDSRFQERQSVMQYQLQSILVVPLEIEGRVTGALYLDHRYQTRRFSEEDRVLLTSFAAQAALALEKARMIAELRAAKEQLQGQVASQAARIETLTEQLAEVRADLKYEYGEIVGASPPMMRVFQLLDHVTETTIPVWIFGESGTGKELIAHSLHYNSPRKKGPFVTENVSSIPETLLESELFGHKRGAFTHADKDRIGLFEQASGGTLFLDEVADMSLAMQAKLLRVLQEGEIRPLGSSKKVKVDVRLVTASNRDLNQLVKEEKFRQDLLFRLNGLTLKLPPLRERKEDIPLLTEHLIQKIARDFNLKPSEVSDEAYQVLFRHSWPGNIRELEGVLRNALLFAKGRRLTPELLALNPGAFAEARGAEAVEAREARAEEQSEERQLIFDALRRHGLDKAKVAEELKISLRTLYTRMEKLRIPKKRTVLAKHLGMA